MAAPDEGPLEVRGFAEGLNGLQRSLLEAFIAGGVAQLRRGLQ